MSFINNILLCLTETQKRKAAILLVFIIVSAFFEAAGVGIVLPALSVLLQPDVLEGQSWFSSFRAFLGEPSQVELVVFGLFFLFFFFVLKVFFLALVILKQYTLIFDVRAELSQKLFEGFIRKPWTFHLQRNSAELINILANETNQFTANALAPGLVFVTETFVLASIFTLLMIVDPISTIVLVSLFGVATFGFHRLTKKYSLRWGEERYFHEGKRVQHVQQGLGGAKEIKLLGRESEFLTLYNIHNIGSARAVKSQSILQQLPRLWIELFTVLGVVIIILLMIFAGRSFATILSTTGLFAVAAFRVMPSANRAVGALQSLRYSQPVVEAIVSELNVLEEIVGSERSAPFVFNSCIKVDNVSFKYAGAEKKAITDVTLEIRRGSCVGLIGSSGAGKSTLVDLVLGLLSPTSGEVLVDEVKIRDNIRGWQNKIGYVPQNIFLTDDSLRRNIAFGIKENEIDDKSVWTALRASQLENLVESLPDKLETNVGERGVRLSGGQRQRIGIARALYHDPEVLVLDEATSALDSETEASVLEAVNNLIGRKTIIIIAHRMSTVEACDQLIRLEMGKVVDKKAARNCA